MRIVKAEYSDLSEILQLQHLAFQSEAILLNNEKIPPLLQTLQELEEEYSRGVILKAVDTEDKIVGSVRGHVERNTLYIGKLIVHPTVQNRGIGRKLLDEIERLYPRLRYEIFTSSKSSRTLKMYEKRGYRQFKEKIISDIMIVYMEKENSFSAAIAKSSTVIPDIKCISPKHGDLLRGRDPAEVASNFVECGATVLSVVTEERNFGGSKQLLRSIVERTRVPVLCKDFFTTRAQLEEVAALGAAAVLLIVGDLSDAQLTELHSAAHELGMDALVEVCNEAEMERALALGAPLIGINNRDISTLELDDGGVARTERILGSRSKAWGTFEKVPQTPQNFEKRPIFVSESGISTPADARRAKSAGANAILVGTALWMAEDMEKTYRSLLEAMQND